MKAEPPPMTKKLLIGALEELWVLSSFDYDSMPEPARKTYHSKVRCILEDTLELVCRDKIKKLLNPKKD